MSKVQQVHRWLGRAIGLDLHREFCEIAICESGQIYGGGRVKMTDEGIETLAGCSVRINTACTSFFARVRRPEWSLLVRSSQKQATRC